MFWGVNEQLEKRLKLKCKDIYICSRKGCFFCLLGLGCQKTH